MADDKKSSKAATAGGLLAGIFGGNILKNIAGNILGEVASKAGEQLALQVKEGGKDLHDEALYNIVTLAELDDSQYKSLEEFTLQLYKDDQKQHTERLADLILFIATGAQEFEETKEKSGTGKDAKVFEKKTRITKPGGDFLKKLIAKKTYEERLDFCRIKRVFDNPTGGYLRVAKKIAAPIKEHCATNTAETKSLTENWLAKAKQKFEDSKIRR